MTKARLVLLTHFWMVKNQIKWMFNPYRLVNWYEFMDEVFSCYPSAKTEGFLYVRPLHFG